jgi:CheY-like chemotaxis protein
MILLAINSRTVLLQAEHICTQDARQTLSASTLQQARAHLAANPVQAIVLDDWFPDGRGVDLLRELREAGSDHVPVISIGSQSIRDPGAAGDDESGDWSGHPPDASIAKADHLGAFWSSMTRGPIVSFYARRLRPRATRCAWRRLARKRFAPHLKNRPTPCWSIRCYPASLAQR